MTNEWNIRYSQIMYTSMDSLLKYAVICIPVDVLHPGEYQPLQAISFNNLSNDTLY